MWPGFEVVRVVKMNENHGSDGRFSSASEKAASGIDSHRAEAANHMAFAKTLSQGPNSKAAFTAMSAHMEAASAHKDAADKMETAQRSAQEGSLPYAQIGARFSEAGAASDKANGMTQKLKP